MRAPLPLLAAAAALSLVTATAEAVVAFPDPVALGETEVLTQSFTDSYADQASFTIATEGDVTVQIYGLTDSLFSAGAIFEDQSAFGFGNLVAGTGSVGSLVISGLDAGTYELDLIATTFPATLKGTFGVNVTLTPVPAGLALLAPALVGLGWVGWRRKAMPA